MAIHKHYDVNGNLAAVSITEGGLDKVVEYDHNHRKLEEGHEHRRLTDYVPAPKLGWGWNINTQLPTMTQCFDTSDIVLGGQPSAMLKFSSSMTSTEMQDVLGVDLSATTSVDLFSGSATASYARSVQSTSYSISYNFYIDTKLPTQMLHLTSYAQGNLNDLGLGAFNEGYETFTDVCGTHVCAQEMTGASLYATVKVSFNSQYAASQFEAEVGGNVQNFGSMMAKLQNAATSTSTSSTVELFAMQQGGNVMKLAKILGDDEEKSILKCSLTPSDTDPSNNIDQCQEAVNNILVYAESDFINQISYSDTGAVVGVPTTLSCQNLDLTKLGYTPDLYITPEQEAIRDYLGSTLNDMTDLKNYLDNWLYSSTVTGVIVPTKSYDNFESDPPFSGTWTYELSNVDYVLKAEMEASYTSVINILNALNADVGSLGAIACYETPDTCDDVQAHIEEVISDNKISYSSIDFTKSSYSLSTRCNGIDYGIRPLMPIKYDDSTGTAYLLEQTQFAFNDGTYQNMTNIYAFEVEDSTDGSGKKVLTLSIVSGPDATTQCFRDDTQENPATDPVPYFESSVDNDCEQLICPVPVGSQSVTAVAFEQLWV